MRFLTNGMYYCIRIYIYSSTKTIYIWDFFCICDNSSPTSHHSQFITASIHNSSLGPFIDRSVNELYSRQITISKIVAWSFVYALHSRRFFRYISKSHYFIVSLMNSESKLIIFPSLFNYEIMKKINKSMLWKI